MSFFPKCVQSFLAPDPPATTQSDSPETTQPDPAETTQSAFNVISLKDLKAHHRGAGPEFTVNSIIKAIYGDRSQSSIASEGTHARQEHGHSDAQESCRGLEFKSNTSVRTVHGDSTGPALYPDSQLYEHIIGIKESESGSVEEQQTHYDNVIKFIGASVVSSTGPDPTNVVAILFGEKSRCQPPPMLVAGLSNKERDEFWAHAHSTNGRPGGDHSTSNADDQQSKISLSSTDFPTLANSVQDIINVLDKSPLPSPLPPSVETSYGTFVGQEAALPPRLSTRTYGTMTE
jgi:hypothetical protein